MPTLHVRNVSDNLYDRLRQRAQERNRSLSAEVVTLLDFALEESSNNQSQLLKGIRRRRFCWPGWRRYRSRGCRRA